MAVKRKKFTLENVLITDYAAEGRSVAKIDGKVYFVEGAVPGDIVDIFVTKNKKSYAEGRVVAIRQQSTNRMIPFCIHFGICGGCKWQMIPYRLQLQLKDQELREVFKRIGKLENVPVLPILGSEHSVQYRNKLEFTFSNKQFLTAEQLEQLGENDWPGGALGYHVPRLYDKIIDIHECWLMDGINNKVRNLIRDFAIANNYSYYDIKNHSGFLRNIIIRYTTTNELMVNLIFGHDDPKKIKALCDYLLTNVPEITTLLYTINQKWNDTIYDLSPKIVTGKGFLIEQLGEFDFKISPKSFFQTNTAQALTLYNVVKDFADLKGTEILYDLYCGTGSIGIYLSKYVQKLIGVEVIEDAIEDATENAAMNGLADAHFFAGDVIQLCNDDFFLKHGRPDVVVVDPPRAGLHAKLVEKLMEINPPKIVYVSCNVATQARDLQLFSEKFTIEKLQPVDMFPHTHHIECVALLKSMS